MIGRRSVVAGGLAIPLLASPAPASNKPLVVLSSYLG